MNATLASLILQAIALMLRSAELALPAPLKQMAPALGQTRSYRMVTVNTQALAAAGSIHRAETVMVRRGTAVESYTTLHTRIAEGVVHSETIATETATYHRRNRESTWEQSEPPRDRPGGAMLRSLEALGTGVQWTDLGDGQIRGHSCLGYEALRDTEDGTHEQVVLWIAQDIMLPVEMSALTGQKSKPFGTPQAGNMSAGTPQVLISQVVTWSEWDSPTLTIPAH